jgi:hypothetical protein
MTPDRVRTRLDAQPIRKTTATLRRKAQEALLRRMSGPSESQASKRGSRPS